MQHKFNRKRTWPLRNATLYSQKYRIQLLQVNGGILKGEYSFISVQLKTLTGRTVACRRSFSFRHIFIEESEEFFGFFQEVEYCLTKIVSGHAGHELLKTIKRYTRNDRYVIILYDKHKNYCSPFLSQQQLDNLGNPDYLTAAGIASRLATRRLLCRGHGASAEVHFCPFYSLKIDQDGYPSKDYSRPEKSYLALAHELLHAMRIMKGSASPAEGDRYDPRSPAGREELRVVGLSSFYGKRLSENSIRREHGEPLRLHYGARYCN